MGGNAMAHLLMRGVCCAEYGRACADPPATRVYDARAVHVDERGGVRCGDRSAACAAVGGMRVMHGRRLCAPPRESLRSGWSRGCGRPARARRGVRQENARSHLARNSAESMRGWVAEAEAGMIKEATS
jgi:hypothetical protein